MPQQNRGARNIQWIESYCLVPSGPERGQHARLTCEQRDTVRRIYDNGRQDAPVTGPLAAYLALLHTCGPEAVRQESQVQPRLNTDVFTLWGATGPDLKAVLKRDGGHIVCPELGTRYPTAA
jgi:hypothetical protein